VTTVLAFVRSRFSSPTFALQCVELLEVLYARLRVLLTEAANTVPISCAESHPFMAPVSFSTPNTPTTAIISQAVPSPNRSVSSADSPPKSVSSSPRLLLSHMWRSYCKPLLMAFRCVLACSTDRVRVLYNTFHALQRQRQQAEAAAQAAATSNNSGGTLGFGLLRSTPAPPTANAATAQPVPLSDYVVYMQEYAHVRMQTLLLLRQMLLSDVFAQCVSENVSRFGERLAFSSSPVAAFNSTVGNAWHVSSPSAIAHTTSWVCSAFWQMCLDEMLFPLLRDLASSASQSLFLESSVSFGLLRAQGVNLLSKVFLRTLPSLLRHQSVPGSAPSADFTRTWLNVLKTLDRYMQLGVHLQRQQTNAAAHAAKVSSGAAGAAAAAISSELHVVPLALAPIPGIAWSSDTGLQLTEAVAEALKNVVLVMKGQGVFALAPFSGAGDGKASSALSSNALPATAEGAAPSGELWQLTVGMLAPWLPFIPALQTELAPPPQPSANHVVNPPSFADESSQAAPTEPAESATQRHSTSASPVRASPPTSPRGPKEATSI
jgi:hypothetical protein